MSRRSPKGVGGPVPQPRSGYAWRSHAEPEGRSMVPARRSPTGEDGLVDTASILSPRFFGRLFFLY